MRYLVAVGSVLVLAVAGCSGPVRGTVAPDATSGAPEMRSITARVDGSQLRVEVTTNRPIRDLGDQDLQVFVDADDDPATGYGAHGDEYVARTLESPDGTRFPVRLTGPPDPSDPAGWGAVVGTGTMGVHWFGPVFEIPLAAFGDHRGPLRVRVEMYAGGRFAYLDTDAVPLTVASR